MNILCSICAELFKNTDADNVNITHCGHVFHSVCLINWLERAKTCPECRAKTTRSTIIRVYYNTSSMNDSSIIQEYAGSKMVELQSENDNLKFQILEKNGLITSKEDSIKQLNKENEKLKANDGKSRLKVKDLEQRIESFCVIEKQYAQTINRLNAELSGMKKIQGELDDRKTEIKNMYSIKQILVGSKAEAEKIMSENRSIDSLATLVAVLKQQLKVEGDKQSILKVKNRELESRIQEHKSEKSALEEKISILESNLYQAETNLKQFEDSSPDANRKEKTPGNLNETDEIAATPEQVRRPLIPVAKLRKPDSPYLPVRASSLAGIARSLAPATLKRQAASSSAAPSPKLLILKKPRLFSTAPSGSMFKSSIFHPK